MVSSIGSTALNADLPIPSKPRKATQRRRFFDLPREIRDQIYSNICKDQRVLIEECFTNGRSKLASALCKGPPIPGVRGSSIGRASNIGPGMFLASRQFHDEMARAFFSTVCFDFGTCDRLDKFLRQIADKHREMITSVELRTAFFSPSQGVRCTQDAAKMLLRLPGLERLAVKISGFICCALSRDEPETISERFTSSTVLSKLKAAEVSFEYRGEAQADPGAGWRSGSWYVGIMQAILCGEPDSYQPSTRTAPWKEERTVGQALFRRRRGAMVW